MPNHIAIQPPDLTIFIFRQIAVLNGGAGSMSTRVWCATIDSMFIVASNKLRVFALRLHCRQFAARRPADSAPAARCVNSPGIPGRASATRDRPDAVSALFRCNPAGGIQNADGSVLTPEMTCCRASSARCACVVSTSRNRQAPSVTRDFATPTGGFMMERL